MVQEEIEQERKGGHTAIVLARFQGQSGNHTIYVLAGFTSKHESQLKTVHILVPHVVHSGARVIDDQWQDLFISCSRTRQPLMTVAALSPAESSALFSQSHGRRQVKHRIQGGSRSCPCRQTLYIER